MHKYITDYLNWIELGPFYTGVRWWTEKKGLEEDTFAAWVTEK